MTSKPVSARLPDFTAEVTLGEASQHFQRRLMNPVGWSISLANACKGGGKTCFCGYNECTADASGCRCLPKVEPIRR